MNIKEESYHWNGKPGTRSTTTALILHHAAAVTCTAQDVHRWHLANGWCGIGYHFLVRKDGSVYRGRPENWIGAHAKNSNSFSIGICFEGNYESETAMPAAQLKAGQELIAYLKGKYGSLRLLKHKDVNATSCPGRFFPWNEMTGEEKTTTSTEIPESNPYAVPTSNLQRGSKGDGVRWVQWMLIDQGYSVGLGGVDGDFGPDTEAAVRKFQKDKGAWQGGDLPLQGTHWSRAKGQQRRWRALGAVDAD